VFLGTLDLIDPVRSINVAGIRHLHPDADETRVREILIERLRIIRKVEPAASAAFHTKLQDRDRRL
jgi:hypothetical protein